MNRKLLLADDDTDEIVLFREALKDTIPFVECHAVENGVELFELLAKNNIHKPDVIFLDINMPQMNGWECLRKLKESEYKSIPTIVYSTSSAKKDIEMAYSLGALLFLTKPEDFMELSKILEIAATASPDDLASQLKEFKSIQKPSPVRKSEPQDHLKKQDITLHTQRLNW